MSQTVYAYLKHEISDIASPDFSEGEDFLSFGLKTRLNSIASKGETFFLADGDVTANLSPSSTWNALFARVIGRVKLTFTGGTTYGSATGGDLYYEGTLQHPGYIALTLCGLTSITIEGLDDENLVYAQMFKCVDDSQL
jgi:hypothetical protein